MALGPSTTSGDIGMRALGVLAILLSGGFLVLAVAVRIRHYGYFGDSLMDDSFFFVRYADVFLDTGVFGWNAGEGPVHGNTSQFYQMLVTVAHALLGRNAVLALTVAAAIGAIAYLVAMPLAYAASRPRIDPTLRMIVCAAAVVLIAFDGQVFLLLGTGMETSWAMALVAFLLAATFRLQNGSTGRAAVLLCAMAIVLVYAVRPDAVLLALSAPAGLALFATDEKRRRAALQACALGVVLVGLFMAVCWLYYGDALPLAFQAKTIGLTQLPPDGRDEVLGYPFSHLRDTILLHQPETSLGLGALLVFPRLSPVLRGAALGMLAYVAYHLFLVLPIMGYFGRFYAPALPVLLLLALHVVEGIVGHSGIARGLRHLTLSGVMLLVGLGLLIASKTALTGLRVVASHRPALEAPASLDTAQGAIAHAAQTFPFFRGRMVALVEALDAECSIAATEDGLLSAYARNRRIVDLSGLHDPTMARHGFSADRLLGEQRPDVLAMPHPWYGAWTRALQANPALARDYDIEAAFTEAGRPIAFRRDSACAQRVRRAVYPG